MAITESHQMLPNSAPLFTVGYTLGDQKFALPGGGGGGGGARALGWGVGGWRLGSKVCGQKDLNQGRV